MSRSSAQSPQLSRLPYLPGLDGMRAVAVIAVMIYHADHEWLSGGFLGVEVFFVISGYLITLLLIGEHERHGRVNLAQFWMRRARRLLPALFLLLSGLAVYMTLFRRTPMGRTRGDFLGGIFYGSNWYQIVVGQGYTASEAFVPLRHLWSLAVEEQFYLIWPLVMVLVLVRRARRDLPRMALWFAGASVAVAIAVALLFHSGDVAATCTIDQRQGYFTLFGRCMSINETLYLGTFSRAGGLLIGAAFAMVWRPVALLRGGLRDRGRDLDVVGVAGLLLLGWLMWTLWLSENGRHFGIRFDPWLFRGGFLLTGIATLAVIAGVTHQGGSLGRLLGNPVFNWVGTRSYGLYLYHWPVYQIIRGEAGTALDLGQFIVAMLITVPIAEASYRWVELPIRQGRLSALLRSRRSRHAFADDQFRRRMAGAMVLVTALVAFAVVSIAFAPNVCVGKVECSLVQASGTTESPPPAETTPTTQTTVPVGPSVTPQSTTSSTSTSTTTSTTLPVDQRPTVAIGESVMLGAKAQLEAAGFYVDAVESRQGTAVPAVLAALRSAGRLGNTVVIHIGTNGDVSDNTFDAIMANLPASEVKTVLFLTISADRPWVEGNNARIIALQSRYSNVSIGYWDGLAPTIAGIANDGIHLATKQAQQAYADLIVTWAHDAAAG